VAPASAARSVSRPRADHWQTAGAGVPPIEQKPLQQSDVEPHALMVQVPTPCDMNALLLHSVGAVLKQVWHVPPMVSCRQLFVHVVVAPGHVFVAVHTSR